MPAGQSNVACTRAGSIRPSLRAVFCSVSELQRSPCASRAFCRAPSPGGVYHADAEDGGWRRFLQGVETPGSTPCPVHGYVIRVVGPLDTRTQPAGPPTLQPSTFPLQGRGQRKSIRATKSGARGRRHRHQECGVSCSWSRSLSPPRPRQLVAVAGREDGGGRRRRPPAPRHPRRIPRSESRLLSTIL